MIRYANFVISSPDVMQCLTHNPKLAKTSQKPGKTLLINHFSIESQPAKGESQQWHIVDLPGYGYARASQTQRDNLRRMIERYCLLREQLCNLFVLVDSRLEAQKIDIEFMNWLGEQQIPFAIVFTKADKQGRERLKENVEAYKKVLLETWDELPPIFVASAEKNQGGEEIVEYIEEINRSLSD